MASKTLLDFNRSQIKRAQRSDPGIPQEPPIQVLRLSMVKHALGSHPGILPRNRSALRFGLFYRLVCMLLHFHFQSRSAYLETPSNSSHAPISIQITDQEIESYI
jgi:hypothetical protein